MNATLFWTQQKIREFERAHSHWEMTVLRCRDLKGAIRLLTQEPKPNSMVRSMVRKPHNGRIESHLLRLHAQCRLEREEVFHLQRQIQGHFPRLAQKLANDLRETHP